MKTLNNIETLRGEKQISADAFNAAGDAFNGAEGLYMNRTIYGKPIGVTYPAEGGYTDADLQKMGLVGKENRNAGGIGEQSTEHIGFRMGDEGFNVISKDIEKAEGIKVVPKEIEKTFDSFGDTGEKPVESDTVIDKDPKTVGNFSVQNQVPATTVTKTASPKYLAPTPKVIGVSLLAGVGTLYGLRKYTKMKPWEVIAISITTAIGTYALSEHFLKNK